MCVCVCVCVDWRTNRFLNQNVICTESISGIRARFGTSKTMLGDPATVLVTFQVGILLPFFF